MRSLTWRLDYFMDWSPAFRHYCIGVLWFWSKTTNWIWRTSSCRWCRVVIESYGAKHSYSVCSRVFSFAMFATQSVKLVGALWACAIAFHYSLHFSFRRSKRVGQSISAAQKFFDLFDRTPAIDNSSTQGRELVSLISSLVFLYTCISCSVDRSAGWHSVWSSQIRLPN